jgi:hypothetical protein
MRMRYFVVCVNIFPHYMKNGKIFENVIEYKMWFDFLHNFCLEYYSSF